MGMHRFKGFTLIELLVAIFVLSIVLTMGVPAFTQFVQNNRMVSGVNDLISTLHAARVEAVKRKTLGAQRRRFDLCERGLEYPGPQLQRGR